MDKKFEHIPTSEPAGFAAIEINDITGFVNLAHASGVKFIFSVNGNAGNSPSQFYFPLNLVVYRISANGYTSVNDAYHAAQKKFPDAADYYEALKNGYDSYEEFRHSKTAGSNGSKEKFEEAKAAGFVRGYDTFLKKYEKYKTGKHTAAIPHTIDSPLALCQYAETKGFKAWHEFEKAYDAGYPDAALFSEASSKGFNSADDFFDAAAKGFSLPTEYEEAKRLLIASKKEWDDYVYLKAGNFRNLSYDQHHLLRLLREYDNGYKFSLAKLRILLASDQEKYKRTFTGSDVKALPVWYSQKINTDDTLHQFLLTSPEIKNMGTYDPAAKTFEIFRLNRTKVYVDASNVAHNSAGNSKSIPYFKNLRMIVEELKVWKFTHITIIADASLRHKAKDTFELERIKKLAEYHESPSHTSADKFLLELIHREKCIIVSNDTFSDWQKKDNWVKKNIDNLRVPFMIKDNHVILQGIEKHAKENED